MPFGVANAPATFQRMMNCSMFKEELDAHVLVYLDDILSLSRSHARGAYQSSEDSAEETKRCKIVCETPQMFLLSRESGVSRFWCFEKRDTTKPWQSTHGGRVAKTTGCQRRSQFFGPGQFLQKIHSTISAWRPEPLTDLTKDGIALEMGRFRGESVPGAQEEFDHSTCAAHAGFPSSICSNTLMPVPVSVGGILEQDFGQGLQPVAYESWKLNPAETRYSAYERELLGIVWAIGKWRHYFEGRKFIVQTDHSSLRHLPNQPSVNRRIWKWVSILQGIWHGNSSYTRESQPCRYYHSAG